MLTPTDSTTTLPPFQPAYRGPAALDELVRCLADNHFDVTYGYRKPERFLESYRRVFNEDRDLVRHPRVRNVMVVGAGASFAAFGGKLFPMASQAIDELRDSLGVSGLQDALRLTDGGSSGPADRFAEEELLFQQLHGIENARYDFETQLAILSKFYTPRQIRSALGTIYSRRYYPHFIFEIIAHLLKHRFIDVVINYNFDEVLDQAIQEEVRGGDYQHVISDGDCVDLARLVVDEQLKVPLYIKPHGTISHKSTLRFTKDAYVGMPGDLATFTRKILQGATLENSDRQRDRFQVNLISIGFAFTSVELIETLKGHDRLRIFHINLAGSSNESSLQKNVERLKTPVEQYLIGIRPPQRRTDEAPANADDASAGEDTDSWPSIAHALAALYTGVRARFGDLYQPRHVERHLVVHHLLFATPATCGGGEGAQAATGSGKRLPVAERYYFLARLYVELTLALAKGKGRIDLANLVYDRVGIYFREWRDAEPSAVVSLRKICERLGLEDREGFAGNIYTLRMLAENVEPTESGGPTESIESTGFVDPTENINATEPVDSAESVEPEASGDRDASGVNELELESAKSVLLGMEERVAGTVPSPLARRLWTNLVRELKQLDDPEFRVHIETISRPGHPVGEFVMRALSDLPATEILELAPRFGMDALLLLNRPSRKAVVHTKLGITLRFDEMLDSPEWDLMLCVSEHGQVLNRLANYCARTDPAACGRDPRIKRRASVVVADSPHSAELDARLATARENRLLIGGEYRLPYWTHNDHMMVAMRMDVHPGRFTPLAAITYRRIGLESRINPLFVEDEEDLELLVRTFFGYVTKARFYGSTIGGVPDIDSEQVRATREELEQRWWTEMMGRTSDDPM